MQVTEWSFQASTWLVSELYGCSLHVPSDVYCRRHWQHMLFPFIPSNGILQYFILEEEEGKCFAYNGWSKRLYRGTKQMWCGNQHRQREYWRWNKFTRSTTTSGIHWSVRLAYWSPPEWPESYAYYIQPQEYEEWDPVVFIRSTSSRIRRMVRYVCIQLTSCIPSRMVLGCTFVETRLHLQLPNGSFQGHQPIMKGVTFVVECF